MSTIGCSSTNKEAEGAATAATMGAMAVVTAPIWGPVAIARSLVPDNKERNINIEVGDTKNKVESLIGLPHSTYSCNSPNYEVWEYTPPLIEQKHRYIVFDNKGNLHEFAPSWEYHKKCKANEVLSKNITKLVIYRTNPGYHRYNIEKPFIYLDGKKIGKLGNGQVISTLIEVGNHIVTVKDSFFFMPFTEVRKLQFNAELNNEYYIRYNEDMDNPLSFEFTNKIHYLKRK